MIFEAIYFKGNNKCAETFQNTAKRPAQHNITTQYGTNRATEHLIQQTNKQNTSATKQQQNNLQLDLQFEYKQEHKI